MVSAFWQAPTGQFEGRVLAQIIQIIGIRVSASDGEDAGAHRLRGKALRSRIIPQICGLTSPDSGAQNLHGGQGFRLTHEEIVVLPHVLEQPGTRRPTNISTNLLAKPAGACTWHRAMEAMQSTQRIKLSGH